MELATVRVVSPVSDDNPLGFIVVNETDFDPAVHTLFEASKPDDKSVDADPPADPVAKARAARKAAASVTPPASAEPVPEPAPDPVA